MVPQDGRGLGLEWLSWGGTQQSTPGFCVAGLLSLSCLLGLHALMRHTAVWERSPWQGAQSGWPFATIRLAKELLRNSQRPEVDVT